MIDAENENEVVRPFPKASVDTPVRLSGHLDIDVGSQNPEIFLPRPGEAVVRSDSALRDEAPQGIGFGWVGFSGMDRMANRLRTELIMQDGDFSAIMFTVEQAALVQGLNDGLHIRQRGKAALGVA